MTDSRNPMFSLYKLLAMQGVNPKSLIPNYRDEDAEYRVAVGLPETNVGISLPGDRTEPLIEEDWHIVNLTMNEIEVFSKVYEQVENLAFEHVRRESSLNQKKKGSKEEELLLEAILRANIKMPDRNFKVKRENGTELTTPDFTWAEYKVAFFMDGLWWHQSLDDNKLMGKLEEAAGDDEKKSLLFKGNRTRAQKDADNRSELASRGWVILSCTDADLETKQGIAKQVKRIQKALRTAAESRSGADLGQKEPDFDPLDDI